MSSKSAVRPLGALSAFLLAMTPLYAAPASALTCTAYTNEATCQKATRCAWSTTYGCSCNAAAGAQVLFVLDSSGSVGSAGWAQATNFVAGMIETGVTPSSKVGVVKFATTAKEVLHFDSNQTRSSLAKVVRGMSYADGETDTAAAMKMVISTIDAHNKGLPTYVFLITDGNPNVAGRDPNPCSAANASIPSDLAARGVTTIIVPVGPNIKVSTLGCLYNNDPSRVVSASSYASSALQPLRSALDEFICK